MDTTIVFSGGPPPSEPEQRALAGRLAGTPVVRSVAADSGLQLADALGFRLLPGRDVVLGDMDSITPARLAEAEAEGLTVVRFPADKDATDLELALDDAASTAGGGDRIVVVGTTSGRLDHVLATLWALAARRYDRFVRDAWLGTDVVHVVDAGMGGSRSVSMPPGSTFSLLAVHGPAVGVTATGVRWELHGETLDPGASRGVSNVSLAEAVTVACEQGTLLVVVPGSVVGEVSR